ncbi:hypothetical protein DERF_001806 [Dermatophagoides farinae]|uniref:Uncharacterized protein n=1 Tax=Dermatophagoides farinae TaxID=6954 RepID=A0A922ICI2_DERFA|nr:hypothetical protein DERF_001806 [Dermatophagoides farinae]
METPKSFISYYLYTSIKTQQIPYYTKHTYFTSIRWRDVMYITVAIPVQNILYFYYALSFGSFQNFEKEALALKF